jgi:hypothetical protein
MTRAQAKFITPVPRVDDTLLRCTIFPGRESEKVKTGLSVQRSHVSFRQLRTSPVAFGTTSLGFQCLGGEDLLDLAHKDVLDDVARFRVDRDPGPRGLSKAGRAPGRSLASHSFSFAVLRAKTSAATLRKPGGSSFQSNRCGRSSQNRRKCFRRNPLLKTLRGNRNDRLSPSPGRRGVQAGHQHRGSSSDIVRARAGDPH